jgi:hypothetical protein
MQSEDLLAQLQAHHEKNSEGKIVSLQKRIEGIQKELEDQKDSLEAMTQENTRLLSDKSLLQLRATKVDTEVRRMKRARQLDEKEAEVNQKVTRGLKERLDKAEGELERLKRKRKDSVSPDRVVTGILKRPGSSPPSAQKAAKTDTPPASVQPAPKKSRTRRNRFFEEAAGLTQHSGSVHSAGLPLTSFNQDGVKEKKEQTSHAKKRDPVLNNPPSSVRRKNDIINEIEESTKTLSLTGKDTSLVFYRSNVDDQVVVTKKALAYVESIITTTCLHMLKGEKAPGNPVQGYLGTLSPFRIAELQSEVDSALEQCEDSNKHMAVYRGGDDLAQRIRTQSFDKDKKPLRPHKATDSLHRLHERLGCHKQYSIPIGFFYAKWSEKLHFHFSRIRAQKPTYSSSLSSRSRTPSPRAAPASTRSAGVSSSSSKPHESKIAASSAAGGVTYSIEDGEDALKVLQETRAAIFDDTKDGLLSLSKHHKAVFWYRQNRRQKWQAAAAGTMLNESEWNIQHDQEALEKLQKSEEELETQGASKSIGYGPAGQGSN